MQMRSSATRTCRASRSAVECAAIAVMPSSRHARAMRTATSPRFAIRTRRNTRSRRRLEDEERRPVLDRGPVLDEDPPHGAARFGGDLVRHLHRLDDAEDLPGLDERAELDERRRVGARSAVERSDHRRGHDDLASRGTVRGRRAGGGSLRYRAVLLAYETNLAAAVLDLEFGDAVIPHQPDELPDLSDVHSRKPHL